MKHEKRAYETKDGTKIYRFSGRFSTGYPKDLEAMDARGSWFPCPNVNIGRRIMLEEVDNPACAAGDHHMSRLTISSIHCKVCGLVLEKD